MNKQRLIDVFCFIITSARGCLEEPPVYGPLRLLEAYLMLVDALGEESIPSIFLEEKKHIEEYMMLCMYDEKAFQEEVDKTINRIAKAIAG